MNLSSEQKAKVQSWVEMGASLSEVQRRLKEELGMSLTYFEARLLADDLQLKFKDKEVPVEQSGDLKAEKKEGEAKPGKVVVTIDQISRPGCLISGRVKFSDGEGAEWYLDQTGRLGLNPDKPGYRPSRKDIMDFQVELDRVAQSQGY